MKKGEVKKGEVRKFRFPIGSLSNAGLVMDVLAGWFVETLERLCEGKFAFVCFEDGVSSKWYVRSNRNLVHRVYEYEVICDGDRWVVVVLSEKGDCKEFYIRGKKVMEMEFEEVVSQVESILGVIREAVEVREKESERVGKILSEDERFADILRRIFECRLGGNDG
jgi:hypothetical protein